MATSAQHNAARNDNDLLARLVAVAEQQGIESAQTWAETNRGRIVAATIGDTTLADVHAYAVASYAPPPPTRCGRQQGHRRPDPRRDQRRPRPRVSHP